MHISLYNHVYVFTMYILLAYMIGIFGFMSITPNFENRPRKVIRLILYIY